MARISKNYDDWHIPESTPTPKKRGMIELNDEVMKEAKKSLKEKGIKSEDVKNLPPIEELCKPIPPTVVEVHALQFNSGDVPYGKTPDQCLDEFDNYCIKQDNFNKRVERHLEENSRAISNLHDIVERTSNDVKMLVKHFQMVQTQIDQLTKVQNDLLVNASKEKHAYEIRTRGGATTHDPLYPKGHPKRVEQDSQRADDTRIKSKKKKKKENRTHVESSDPAVDPNSISIFDAETESGNEKSEASDKEEVEEAEVAPEKQPKNVKYTKEDFIANKHGKEREPWVQKLMPFPDKKHKSREEEHFNRFCEWMKPMCLQIHLTDAIKLPPYSKYMKDIVSNKRKIPTEEISTMLANYSFNGKVPKKLGDPEMPEDDNMSIILGRPFLNTAGAVIDCNQGNVTFNVNDKEHTVYFPKKINGAYCLNSIINIETIQIGQIHVPMSKPHKECDIIMIGDIPIQIEDFECNFNSSNPMVHYKIYNKSVSLPLSVFCAAIKVPCWGSYEKLKEKPQHLADLYKEICQGRSFKDENGKIKNIQLPSIRRSLSLLEPELDVYIAEQDQQAEGDGGEAEDHSFQPASTSGFSYPPPDYDYGQHASSSSYDPGYQGTGDSSAWDPNYRWY
ncbi:hypothetical protein QYE76_010738 [Lolium multiflorum]|uniref:Uncharacterized protein n=1 Tax=Lolium multiflorum TaxID=4521 RepID=A0AAD8TUB2_LOLMU|nr:hypothetical protein QYE76_010738 [Lolium multiflorum]